MANDENDAESKEGVFSLRSSSPLPSPTAIAAAKAAAAGAISTGAGYRTKKALEATTRKKRVGNISAAQWAANKRQIQQMSRRTGAPPLASLRLL